MRLFAKAGLAALAAILAVSGADPARSEAMGPAPAAARAVTSADDDVFYHVFIRSMRDSDGDGIGDLKGINDSLGYLQDLGVTAILLTPLYPSHVYHNYFASDFEGVDPEFGTMADYAALVSAVHGRGMKIYLDMEFQYLADDHAWWKAAQEDRSSPFADYMLWDDRAAGVAEEGPFGLREIENFSGHTFGVTTVNLKHPAVKAWADDYLMGWVDPNGDGEFTDGVDGFRLDHMMDDLDSKGLLTNLFADFWKPAFERIRAVNPQVRFLAEQWDWKYGEEYLTRADTDFVFGFPLYEAINSFDAGRIASTMAATAAATPAGKHQLTFIENHDVSRMSSAPGMTPVRQRTAAALLFALRGTPILYYGQELGMRGLMDPGYKTDESAIGVREAFEWHARQDGPNQAVWYRRPGQRYWDQRFTRDDDGISVEEQIDDPKSLLSHYRRLTALRRQFAALRSGEQRVLDSAPGVLVIERSLGDQTLIVVANLTDGALIYGGPGAGSPDLISGGGPRLEPGQTAIFDAS